MVSVITDVVGTTASQALAILINQGYLFEPGLDWPLDWFHTIMQAETHGGLMRISSDGTFGSPGVPANEDGSGP